MSILIKGMEMPKNCNTCMDTRLNVAVSVFGAMCPFCEKIFLADIDIKKQRLDDCPLIELPPHGRLIDADELIRELASEHVGGLDAIKKYTNADTWTSGLHTAWRLIDDAETVIEAEGRETNA